MEVQTFIDTFTFILVVCVRSDNKEHKKLETKFSVPNIKSKSSHGKMYKFPAIGETEDTKGLSIAQLERLVLLDQLKFYKMQMEELQRKKEESMKQEKSTVNLLQDRDCIAV